MMTMQIGRTLAGMATIERRLGGCDEAEELFHGGVLVGMMVMNSPIHRRHERRLSQSLISEWGDQGV